MSDIARENTTEQTTIYHGGLNGWALAGVIALAILGGILLANTGVISFHFGVSLPTATTPTSTVVVGGTVAPPAIDTGITNWVPPVEPAGQVDPGKQAPLSSMLWGQNDPRGPEVCTPLHQTFRGWIGKGAQRHAWCS